MSDSEYLEAILLRHFFGVENEKTELLDEEEGQALNEQTADESIRTD